MCPNLPRRLRRFQSVFFSNMPPQIYKILSYRSLADHSISLLILFLLLLYVLSACYSAYGSALRKLPGPGIARFTRLYHTSMTWNGKLHEESQRLHPKYGPIVRSGPNHVSISDPEMIPLIFGVSSKFVKVRLFSYVLYCSRSVAKCTCPNSPTFTCHSG
jgi:hypothetical protein